jgi:hypothetical protein
VIVTEASIARQTVQVCTHHDPDLDEIEALRRAMVRGTAEFLRHYSIDERLYLGIGAENGENSYFDEHPRSGHFRKEGHCCATLMAEALNDWSDPHILEFVRGGDLEGRRRGDDLAAVTGNLYRVYPNEPWRVINWALLGLDAKSKDPTRSNDFRVETIHGLLQTQYPNQPDIANQWLGEALTAKKTIGWLLRMAKEEFESSGQYENITGPKGRNVVLATIISNNPRMASYLRGRWKVEPLIILQQGMPNPGQTQILSHQLCLDEVACAINTAEQQAMGLSIYERILEWSDLTSEGNPTGYWYYFGGGGLMNGNPKYPEIPPTQIPLEEIVETVRICGPYLTFKSW